MSDEHVEPFIHDVEIVIDGESHTLSKGMTAKLAPEHGRKQERDYEFRFAEYYRSHNGDRTLILNFHGPVRSSRIRVRRARIHEVLKVYDGQRKRRVRKCKQEDCEYHE